MPDAYPLYIFGMHDRGGEDLMLQKARCGWVLITEAVGADPNNTSSSDYTDLTNKGFSVIVRLNHGYGTAGTIPYSAQYDAFAQRCGNFVEASPGCKIWIIGNEMNLSTERPGGPSGQVITPDLYAACFAKCRAEIRRRPGHETDQVVVGAVGPWNAETKYPGNLRGDWVQYLVDILNLLGQAVDGIALHTYTHGQDPNLVFNEDKMNPPFQSFRYHFRAYRDFLAAIPAGFRNRPIYITETDQYGAWKNENTGWVRNVYKEIDDWNKVPGNQPIQALVLYRWVVGNANDPQEVGWAITNKPGVQGDWRDAMNNEYRIVLPLAKPEFWVSWLQVGAPSQMDLGATVQFGVTMRNDGRATWSQTGTQAVRLGYRWIDTSGNAAEGAERTDLPQAVASAETVTLPAARVRAPAKPGYYTLELDLVKGVSDWFAAQGSPSWRLGQVCVGTRYRAAWLSVGAPAEGMIGETVTFPVKIRNDGALIWPSTGNNPVNLTYKWLDANRNVVVADGLRTPLGRDVAPLEEISLQAKVQLPSEAGPYILQMDMVHEFVTWFQWKGSPVHESQVKAKPAVPDYAAEWITYLGPQRLEAGQRGSAYVEVKNTGTKPWPWSGDEAIYLGYRWLDAQGQEVAVDGAKSALLTKTIEPGEVATFRDVSIRIPSAPGTYRLAWDLRQAGVWLSALGVAVLEQPVQVVAPAYGVEWQVLQPWPAWFPPGEEQLTSFRLRNIGTKTWLAAGDNPVHLAYTWFTEDGKLSEPWDTFRTRLPQDVAAGSSVDLFDVPFKTPPVTANYILRYDLVEEGKTWFFRQGGAPLEVPLLISDKPLFAPWTAQASHNAEDAALAFDANPSTFWDSKAKQVPGMWFQVDLGQLLVLDRVRISSPGRGFPVGYRIKLSEDGQDWHLVAEKSKNWTDVEEAFAPCRARYLRLEEIGQPDWPATWMISEIAITCTEPWAGAEASHYTDDTPQALDARLRTYWNTRNVKQKPGMWFRLDMGNLQMIERVTLEHPPNQLPRGYLVQVSADGQTWQEVGRKDDNWGKLDVQFQPVISRYVRVETTNSSAYYPWGIAEFAVWRSAPAWVHGREG
jgi:F5/8 type C domain